MTKRIPRTKNKGTGYFFEKNEEKYFALLTSVSKATLVVKSSVPLITLQGGLPMKPQEAKSLLHGAIQGRIAFSVGVELSYLDMPAQEYLAELINRDEATPSYSQAVRMHRENGQGFESISRERIDEIMAEEKPNQREQICLRRDEFSKYFPSGYSDRQIHDDILAGLDLLRRQRIRERNRDAR